jgi:hypothetical protein
VLLDSFRSIVADQEIDTGWMLFYAMKDLRNALTGRVQDYTGEMKVKRLKEDEDIPYTTLGFDKGQELTPERVGSGLRFNRRWLENNAVVSMNDAISELRLAFELEKSRNAYLTLRNNTDGSPTTWSTDLITTINKAYYEKSEVLRATGRYNITGDSVAYLLYNPKHKSLVNTAFRTVIGTDGKNGIIEYNVIPVSSFHIPATFSEISNKAGGLLIFPGRKLYYGVFDDLFQKEEFKFEKDAIEIGGQEYYTHSVKETKQVSIVPFQS